MVNNVYLLLGTNLGDRAALLDCAIHSLSLTAGKIIRVSSRYETAAWGEPGQPDYLNQVVQLATSLSPLQLLEKIHDIEKQLGRERIKKWEPRLIDIDILLYADCIIDKPNLQIPHPHLPNRKFALIPLQEIAPHLIHPQHKKTITELLECTPDSLAVRQYAAD